MHHQKPRLWGYALPKTTFVEGYALPKTPFVEGYALPKTRFAEGYARKAKFWYTVSLLSFFLKKPIIWTFFRPMERSGCPPPRIVGCHL